MKAPNLLRRFLRRSVVRSPLEPLVLDTAARALIAKRQIDEALELVRKAMAFLPNDMSGAEMARRVHSLEAELRKTR